MNFYKKVFRIETSVKYLDSYFNKQGCTEYNKFNNIF